MAKVNILARVEAAMRSDTEDQQDQSDRIERHYHGATERQRALIDDVFACLCGWSLRTILDEGDVNEDERDEDEERDEDDDYTLGDDPTK